MKLAEALAERKGLQARAQDLGIRLHANMVVQEGETPTEQPEDLRAELERVFTQLGDLIKAINRTNVVTRLEGGETIADAIADRDVLKQRYVALKRLADSATSTRGVQRHARTELRTFVTMDMPALRRELDALARQMRELDVRIQASDWATDLIEG
jgi:hypothetical protein